MKIIHTFFFPPSVYAAIKLLLLLMGICHKFMRLRSGNINWRSVEMIVCVCVCACVRVLAFVCCCGVCVCVCVCVFEVMRKTIFLIDVFAPVRRGAE